VQHPHVKIHLSSAGLKAGHHNTGKKDVTTSNTSQLKICYHDNILGMS